MLQAVPTTNSNDLRSLISNLETKYPRDAEYMTNLFLNFLLVKIVKNMSPNQIKTVLDQKDNDPQKVIESLGEFCKTTTICAETIEEFKELLK